MSFISPGNIPEQLMRLAATPRVQYLGSAAKRALNGQLSAPIGPTAQRTFQTGAQLAQGNAFGRGIGSVISQLGQQQQDPMTQLYNQLISQLQQPVAMPSQVNSSAIMDQVKKAINPIYDQRAQTAQGQSDRARGDVKNMYRALSNDYERLAPEQIAQADAAKKEIEGLYGQLRSNIEGNYSRVSSDQAELFKQLGIEDALPDAMAGQNDVTTDALTAASENQAQQEQRYMDMGQADSTFYREGSPIATMAGNEQSMNLLDQLTDYLNQNESERAAGIQSGYIDQLGQAQNTYNSQLQAAQGQQSQQQQLLMQMLSSVGQNQQSQALTPDSYLASLPQQYQQATANAFTQLQRSPEAVYGKVEDPRNPVPGTFVETTPQWYMQQADQMLNSGQIDPTTHQALMMYLQLYFNKGH